MKKLFLFFTIIIVLVSLTHCDLNNQKPRSFYKLNFKESLKVNVVKTSIHNKGLLLNDSVVLYKTSRLIFESYSPKWLFEKTKNKEMSHKYYIYSPDISDVDVPYVLIKHRNSNIFQIVKDRDTLFFDFENFEMIDFW
jgi:hypothetical protein